MLEVLIYEGLNLIIRDADLDLRRSTRPHRLEDSLGVDSVGPQGKVEALAQEG